MAHLLLMTRAEQGQEQHHPRHICASCPWGKTSPDGLARGKVEAGPHTYTWAPWKYGSVTRSWGHQEEWVVRQRQDAKTCYEGELGAAADRIRADFAGLRDAAVLSPGSKQFGLFHLGEM